MFCHLVTHLLSFGLVDGIMMARRLQVTLVALAANFGFTFSEVSQKFSVLLVSEKPGCKSNIPIFTVLAGFPKWSANDHL